MKILELVAGTDEFDTAVHGMVRAERVNDVIAKFDSKRYREYLHLVREQSCGEPVVDPDDQYRERELVPRALDAYERKHDVSLATGRIYVLDDFPICAAPDGVDSQIGLTVHIRRDYATYRKAIEQGLYNCMYRHSQAMMAVTGLQYWLHLDYLELPEQGIRKLHEVEVYLDKHRARQLLDAMIQFARRTRRAEEAAA